MPLTRHSAWTVLGLLCGLALSGCVDSHESLRYVGRRPLQHYQNAATQIDYADVEPVAQAELLESTEPRRLSRLAKDNIREMTLAEAIHIALSHAEIIRRNGGIVDSFDVAPSVYDSAIQETQPLFGVGGSNTRGVEDALSDFDAQFTTSMLWGRDARISNSFFTGGGLVNGLTLTDETGIFVARLEKTLANSGILAIQHDWNYSGSNAPSRMFPSVYTGKVQAEYRQPLLAGSGVEFTRVAGPRNQRVGINRGVLIARIQQDVVLGDLEARLQDLLIEVENTYWELYLAYQVYHSEVAARNTALDAWDQMVNLADRVKASAEIQARRNYYDTRARAETALSELYSTESRLRRLLGMPINDGDVIRPRDEPVAAELNVDWHATLAEALMNRVELRQQKWRIKELELELRAAQNLARPDLDFVSNYRVNGFGDQLLAYDDRDSVGTAQGLRSGYESLTQGEQTGWNLGFEFSWRMGLRAEHAQVRNIELRLAKARAYLAAKELDIGHELATAVQELDRSHQVMQTSFNRQALAREHVAQLKFEQDNTFDQSEISANDVDLYLRTELSVRDTRNAYYSNLIEYNKALAALEYRKGSLLKYNNVLLQEGDWKPEAYHNALRRAWARSYGIAARYISPEPEPISTDRRQFLLPDPAEDGERVPSSLPTELPPPAAPEPEPATANRTELEIPLVSFDQPLAIESVDWNAEPPAFISSQTDQSLMPAAPAATGTAESAQPTTARRSRLADLGEPQLAIPDFDDVEPVRIVSPAPTSTP